MYFISFFLIIFFPLFLNGQIYKGNIFDKTNKVKIPYATVGLIKENIGTNADDNGDFILTSKNKKNNDTLIVSCVGYETLKIPVNKLSENIFIELNEKEKDLQGITVFTKSNWTFTKLNDFSKCEDWGLTSNGFQTQIAQHFHSPVNNIILTSAGICTQHDILSSNNTIFRIRIYAQDTLTGAPSIDLCNEIIEVRTKNKHTDVDLEKYNIHILSKDFFIAVEWLKIPYNEEKFKPRINKMNNDNIRYRPIIGMTESKKNNTETWMLTYQNHWYPMSFANSIASISATIKY